jgi:hypothetical protein
MSDLLAKYLLYEPSNITHTFIDNLFNIDGVKKNDISIFITHFICLHTLTNNVWFLMRLKMYYEKIEKCKNTEKNKLIELTYGLFHMIASSNKKHYVFFRENEKSEQLQSEIRSTIINSNIGTFSDTEQLKSILSNEVFTLLNIIYDSFLYSIETKEVIQNNFIILRYLLTLTPKQYLKSTIYKNQMNISDFVILICMIYSTTSYCPSELKEYITCVKDIFYYRLKKKDRKKRLNLLFYLIHVIISKDIVNTEIDYEGNRFLTDLISQNTNTNTNNNTNTNTNTNTSTCNISNSTEDILCDENSNNDKLNNDIIKKCKFLYIYTEKDEHLEMEIKYEHERERLMNQLLRVKTKEINIDSLLAKDTRNNVNVMKL